MTVSVFYAFRWWQKAVELGDASQKEMMAKGADRYLNSIGYKQLFATQASTPSMDPGDCWCLEEVSRGILEERRIEYTKRSIKGALEWVDSLNASAPKCRPAKFCEKNLKDPPKGTLALEAGIDPGGIMYEAAECQTMKRRLAARVVKDVVGRPLWGRSQDKYRPGLILLRRKNR